MIWLSDQLTGETFNLMGIQIMTTKAKATNKATKGKTPAINPTAVGRHIGENLGQLQSGLLIAAKATEAINVDVKTLRDAKIKIGASRKTCAVAGAIYDAMPSTLSAGTRANMLSSIRKAVNEGGKFSHNPSRAKSGGKKTGAKQGAGNIVISIGKGADVADVAEKLRKGFNAMKAANDGLATLAAFLIDALDDAGFPESAE
jgi:hypothetical protein